MSFKNKNLIQKIVLFLTSSLLKRISNLYYKRYHKKLPIILVAGTVGKSSQTIIFAEFFKKNGYNVLTGTTQKQNLNTVTGLAMVLGGFYYDLNQGVLNKIKFLLKLAFANLKSIRNLPEKTILISEVGFDFQGEVEEYLYIFKSGVDYLVITALTHEHSQNFDNQFFNQKGFDSIKNILPIKLRNEIEKTYYETVLKNTVIEQLLLLNIAKKSILPRDLEVVNNYSYTNISQGNQWLEFVAESSRAHNFALKIDSRFIFSEKYLLPKSFSKFIISLALVTENFGLDSIFVKDFVKNITLPNSRFSLLQGQNKLNIVDSTYNSDPASLVGFFSIFEEISETFRKNQEKYSQGLETKIPERFWEVGVPPKHYFFLGEMRELGSVSKREHQLILDLLIILMEKHQESWGGLYLLGSAWLDCDEQNIPKMDGYINYILYKKVFFKVYIKVGDMKKDFEASDFSPFGWIWVKGSQNKIYLEELVKHFLLNKNDENLLCRQSDVWLKSKSFWIV